MLEIAKVTAKGQITIPVDIRRRLGIKEGDKVLFLQEGDRIVFTNASFSALEQAQKAMAGVAADKGIVSDEDVESLVKEERKELWRERHESNG